MDLLYASGHTAAAVSLLTKLKGAVIYPLMTLLTAVALLIFLWGVFQYIMGSANEDARETGKRHILFGIIGMLIIVSALAILQIATATFSTGLPLY